MCTWNDVKEFCATSHHVYLSLSAPPTTLLHKCVRGKGSLRGAAACSNASGRGGGGGMLGSCTPCGRVAPAAPAAAAPSPAPHANLALPAACAHCAQPLSGPRRTRTTATWCATANPTRRRAFGTSATAASSGARAAWAWTRTRCVLCAARLRQPLSLWERCAAAVLHAGSAWMHKWTAPTHVLDACQPSLTTRTPPRLAPRHLWQRWRAPPAAGQLARRRVAGDGRCSADGVHVPGHAGRAVQELQVGQRRRCVFCVRVCVGVRGQGL
jgi:hypothetical protein